MASKSQPSGALAGWMAGQRWFAAKSRRIVGTLVEDHLRVAGATLHVVRVGLDDGATHRYAVPLLDGPVPSDALDDPGFCRALLDVMRSARRGGPRGGALLGRPSTAFPADLPADLPVRRLVGEQSKPAGGFGDRLIVTHLPRVGGGGDH